MITIGILETGPVIRELKPEWGDYTDFFQRFLDQSGIKFQCVQYQCYLDRFPVSVDDCDGWMITGSKHGAYDPLGWIGPLEATIRKIVAARRALVGICFGHQIIAQALGGEVVKSKKGWGLGVQSYDFVETPNWVAGIGKRFSGYAIHQDQVVVPPSDATVIAANEFCPFAVMSYGDIKKPHAISIQSHPEFEQSFVEGLIAARTGSVFDAEVASCALTTTHTPVKNLEWSRAIGKFFQLRVTDSS